MTHLASGLRYGAERCGPSATVPSAINICHACASATDPERRGALEPPTGKAEMSLRNGQR